MRGIDLMLLSIYAVKNITDPLIDNSDNWILSDRYNWENSLDTAKVSLTDTHVKKLTGMIPTKLRITTWEDPPFSWTEGTEGNYTGHGFAFVLFDALLSNLNFTYEIIKPTNNLSINEPNGIIKLLHEKEVDIAVTFLPILPQFHEYCSFGSTLSYSDITVLLKRPKVSAVGSGLLAPFDTTVWICILISLIVVGPVIYFFTSYRSYLFNRTKVDKYTFTTSVWFTYGALLKQGSPTSPVHDSNRLLFATWWLFITIVTSFYTANLTAFLTLSEFTLPINSAEDILKAKTRWIAQERHMIDYAMKNVSATLKDEKFEGTDNSLVYLKNSERNGYGRFIKIPHYNKEHNIANIVQNNGNAFLGEKNLIEKIIYYDYMEKMRMDIEEKLRCTLVMMPQYINRQNRAFAYQLNSPIQEIIDRQLLHLTATGIVKHLETYEMPAMKYCPLNLQSKERQLSNDDLMLTYKVIATGFVIAIITFCIEMFQRRSKWKSCLCCSKTCSCCRKRTKNVAKQYPKIPSPSLIPFSIATPKSTQKITPTYESLVYNPKVAKKHVINGRDYWVITEKGGYKRLVPIRSPSAMLFQYTT